MTKMKKGKPRELLIELIGEEETDKWFDGAPIEVKDQTYNYTMERKHKYIDVVRRERPPEPSDDIDSSWQKVEETINEVPDIAKWEREHTRSYRFRLTETEEENGDIRYTVYAHYLGTRRYRSYGSDSGRIKAWNIDDACASFIIASQNGKVNWACGNIDVKLPDSMPPTNLNFTTFLFGGINTYAKKASHALSMVPADLAISYQSLVTPKSEGGDIAAMIIMIVPLLLGFFSSTQFPIIDEPFVRWILFSGIFYIFALIPTSYFYWKNNWISKLGGGIK